MRLMCFIAVSAASIRARAALRDHTTPLICGVRITSGAPPCWEAASDALGGGELLHDVLVEAQSVFGGVDDEVSV